MNKKYSLAIISILFPVVLLMLFRGHMLARHASRLQAEIDLIQREIVEIETMLPALQKEALRLVGPLEKQYAPNEHFAAWCLERVDFPHRPAGFECSFSVIGTRPPLGMALPWPLRQADPYVHPGLVPCLARVALEGTPSQICAYFNDIGLISRSMVITKLDLCATEPKGRYAGYAELAFPQIAHLEDIENIRTFANMELPGP